MKLPQNEPAIIIKAPKSQEWEVAVSEGIELREQKDNSQWALGEFCERRTQQFGKSAIRPLATSIGIPYNSLREYRRVHLKVPPKIRIPHLSYRHHQLAANTDNPEEWLSKASDGSWTSEGMGIEINKSKGREVKEIAPSMERCEICGKWAPADIDERLLCHHRIYKLRLGIDTSVN